jgi:predicted metal-dependent hydrolase
MAIPAIPRSPRTGRPLIPKGAGRRTCRCDEAAPALLRTGIAQFNSGDYWECHETLEELWRGEPDPVRYLYQGILLAGVGLLHLRRGNRRGALSKLRAAVGRLEPYVPVCMGVDVAGLRADLLRLISHLDELDAAAPVALRISVGGRR